MWQISENKAWDYLEQQFNWVRVMKDVPQDPLHHAEGNVAVHTQMVLAALLQLPGYQQLPPVQQEVLWAAALLHDVEKYSTTETTPDGRITSAGHARKGKELPAASCTVIWLHLSASGNRWRNWSATTACPSGYSKNRIPGGQSSPPASK